MKKMKKVMLAFVLVIIVSMAGCGTKIEGEEGEKDNNADVAVQEDWTDDYVITFADEGFEKYIRKILGRLEGDVCYGDVKRIKRLHIATTDMAVSFKGVGDKTGAEVRHIDSEYGDWIKIYPIEQDSYDYCSTWYIDNINEVAGINSFEDLKYLTGLEYLCIKINYPELVTSVTNVRFLESLSNLKYLYLYTSQVYDFDGLEGCANLEELYIRVSGIDSYDELSELKNLRYLYVENGDLEQIKQEVESEVQIDEEYFQW